MSSFRAIQKTGKIISVVGNLLEVSAITVEIGGMAEIDGCLCEVIGARKGVALLMALDPLPRVQLGATVVFLNRQVSLPVGDVLIGRVLDPLGRPKDGKGAIESVEYRPLGDFLTTIFSISSFEKPCAAKHTAIFSQGCGIFGIRELQVRNAWKASSNFPEE
jgi:flagellar biosynthesis/type III secretory pathway ATPase